ncbi:MAG: hypothetical protein RLY32_1584 [Pseudomonadota bacterium]
MKTLRLGCGAGYAGDRIEPAVELAERGQLDYLIFECLAERTIALAQQQKLRDPSAGFDPLLEARMRRVLMPCAVHGTKIITNMGAANPYAAAKLTAAIAREMGLDNLRIASITGDDVLAAVLEQNPQMIESGRHLADYAPRLVSANAYLGAAPIVEALSQGADIVITGRVGDPAMFLAAMVHEFAWSMDDWDRLGQGTLVGHLLECAGQITGGYFADPLMKPVQGLGRLGFPIAEVQPDGSAVITKLAGSGGCVNEQTCKEQILYEVHDPSAYIQADVVADFSKVRVTELSPDRVLVEGATGRARTGLYKVSVGYRDRYIAEGMMSYAGPGAQARAALAADIVKERLALRGIWPEEIRYDLIGINALHGHLGHFAIEQGHQEAYEVRLRVAARCNTEAMAWDLVNEVETLYTNGPAAGGGAHRLVKEVIAVVSCLMPADLVQTQTYWFGGDKQEQHTSDHQADQSLSRP